MLQCTYCYSKRPSPTIDELQVITVEQIVSTQKTNVETFFGLTGKAFEGVQKLIELNISAAKNAITEAAQTTQERIRQGRESCLRCSKA